MPEARARDPRIAAGSDYGNPDPEWRRVDWRSAPAPGRAARRRGQLRRDRRGRADRLRPRPLRQLAELAGEPASLRPRAAGRSRSTCPASAPARCPPGRSRCRPTAGCSHDFCEKLGVEGATVVGNSMGGFIAVEAVTAAPGHFERLVLVSAAGIINTWNPEERAVATAWAWKAFGPHYARRSRFIVSRPRARELVFRPFVRYPARLREDLLLEQIESGLRRAEGFGDALHAVIRHDIRERLGDDRDADDDRLGPVRPGDPDRRSAQLPPPHPPLPPRDLRAHRPRPAAGASGALQRAARRLPSW